MLTSQHLGLQEYQPVWEAMKKFTSNRKPTTPDELWLLEHYPVYTQGQAGKAEHILNARSIPVVQSDRGGQVTYHGPGQLVIYTLVDIQRRQLGIRTFVSHLEKTLITLLQRFCIKAATQCGAPGVYVDGQKIASIGLRVKNGCTYHGIALNVDMDLSPFSDINPCGYHALQMTQMRNYTDKLNMHDIREQFIEIFTNICPLSTACDSTELRVPTASEHQLNIEEVTIQEPLSTSLPTSGRNL
jgi:lipoyl(octanoyl) transferase